MGARHLRGPEGGKKRRRRRNSNFPSVQAEEAGASVPARTAAEARDRHVHEDGREAVCRHPGEFDLSPSASFLESGESTHRGL